MNLTVVLLFVGTVVAVILIWLFTNKRQSEEAEEEIKTAKRTLPPLPDFVKVDPETGKMSLILDVEASETDDGMYLFLDTETTGLPKSTVVSAENFDSFPRIVQISWGLLDADFKCVVSEDFYLKQDVPIPPSAIKIHGITDDIVAEKGEDPKVVFERLLKDINKALYIVAHNIDFDLPIIESEFLRLSMKKPFRGKKKICTMKAGTQFCQLPKYHGRGYKYPTLVELLECCYFSGVSIGLKSPHNAQTDVSILIKCFIKLKELGYIELE